ncbi:MAG: hypothetical protein MRZ54_06650 [Clostridiales bacterium]|nr:hypothetical protein [Clostridiales bacterium]
MERKRNLGIRILAGIAALILAGSMPMLAKGEELSAIQAENAELDELLTDTDPKLEEEYITYLKEHDIPLVDGNIVVQTVRQFEAVRDYYCNYFEENGFFDDLNYYLGAYYEEDYGKDALIALQIFLLNYNEMSNELKRELFHSEIVKILGDGEVSYIMDNFAYIVYKYNYEQFTNREEKNYIQFSPIIFNSKLRKIYAMIEADLKNFGSGSLPSVEAMGNKYLTYFYDDGKTYEPSFFALDDCAQFYLYYYFQPLEYVLEEHNYKDLYFICDLSSYYDWDYLSNDFQKQIEESLLIKESK